MRTTLERAGFVATDATNSLSSETVGALPGPRRPYGASATPEDRLRKLVLVAEALGNELAATTVDAAKADMERIIAL